MLLAIATFSLCGFAGGQRVLGVGLRRTAPAILAPGSKLKVRLDTACWIYKEALTDAS